MFHKSILKITSLLLIIGLNYSGLFAVGETVASFNDKETSEDNFYTAGTLDFSLRFERDNFESVILTQNMKPGDVVSRNIYVKKEGNLTLRYKALSEFIPGNCDEDLYNALKLKILYKYFTEEDGKTILKEVLRYDGFLQAFDDFGTNPKDPDLWIPNDREYVENEFYSEDEHWLSFLINLSEETLEDLWNRSCEFKFVFDGWQKDPNCEESNGFIDEEEIYNELASSGLRINEVYYHSVKNDGEWIEIYNQTDAPIDIEEWVIEDDKGEQKRTIVENSFCNPSCAIPAQGYAVIAGKDKIWDHWPIPSAAVKITLDKKIGNGLGKKGDQIILKRTDETEIDAMSYGDDDTVFELDSVEKGQSLGRGPDGYDTNEASDWLDQGSYGPSPGWSNLIVEDIGGEDVEIFDIDEALEKENETDMNEEEDIEIPVLNDEEDDSDSANGSTALQDNGASGEDGTEVSSEETEVNEEDDDIKNEDIENKKNENNENDSSKDVNSDNANGSTRTEIWKDNGASDENGDDDIKNEDGDTDIGGVDDIEDGDSDGTKNSSQETGANDGNGSDNDTDIKDEEYVLNPKEEENLTEENKETNSDDAKDSTRENETSDENADDSTQESGASGDLNENSVDCVQAIK